MEATFDCPVSSLLCTEEESLVLDDDLVSPEVVEEIDGGWQNGNHQKRNGKRGFYDEEKLNGFPMQSEECLGLMIQKEKEHLPSDDYLERLKNGVVDLDARKEMIDWIQKVHAYFNFRPLCLYLSINYFDRFMSAYELPAKAWTMQLLAVACVSLASKMEETYVPAIVDLQIAESKFVFEAKTIGRMELLVLSTLRWRMHAVTPFSYLDCFLKKINVDQISRKLSINRGIQLVLSALRGIDFLDFRPSEIAAAVAICAAREIQPVDIDQAIVTLIEHVEKDKLLKCMELMHSLPSLGGFVKGPSMLVPSVPPSPIGVLDASCFSYKTDETAAGSCANSSHSSPVAKRMKVQDP